MVLVSYFLPFGISAVVAFVLNAVCIFLARRMGALAHPVERSSHAIPTPQIGGVGICIGSAISLCLFRSWGYLVPLWDAIPVLVFGVALGLYDDIKAMKALPKLFALFGLAMLPLLVHDDIAVASHAIDFGLRGSWVVAVLLFCWFVFFANAYNFMDGTNGQSGVFGLNAILWYIAILFLTPEGRESVGWDSPFPSTVGMFLAILAGGYLGFLPWNFPRARTFMGDSGSLPLGVTLGVLAIWVSRGDTSLIPASLLPLSPFVYDVAYTLVRRARRGENLFAAHKEHLYQRLLVATEWSHARLLAFHVPYYALCGATGLLYACGDSDSRFAAILANMAILVLYTGFVLAIEGRRARA
jgi:UDP-N-acetylmuramyl pentapeptide phosphotransferase/UDP-N-acetylglucosamine-1-phosphate transferase